MYKVHRMTTPPSTRRAAGRPGLAAGAPVAPIRRHGDGRPRPPRHAGGGPLGRREPLRRLLGRGAVPTAAQTERDSLIFHENDVEVFIDGGDCYYEFEINALGTIYEVFFIWRDAYRRGSRFDVPEFDLLVGKAALVRRRLRPHPTLLVGHPSARPALGVPRLGFSGPAVGGPRRRDI